MEGMVERQYLRRSWLIPYLSGIERNSTGALDLVSWLDRETAMRSSVDLIICRRVVRKGKVSKQGSDVV